MKEYYKEVQKVLTKKEEKIMDRIKYTPQGFSYVDVTMEECLKKGVVNMNTKPVNAGKPWTEEELMFVASYVPTVHNCKFLAEKLGRTQHAVQYTWCKLYSRSKDLKALAGGDNQ